MKKLVALILAAIMVMCWLPSLAEDVDNPYAEYGVEILKDANGNKIDLGGMEVIICEHWSHDWHEDEPATASAEATKEWREWLEETYNFKIITRADTTWSACPDDFNNIATAGDDEHNYVWAMRFETIAAPMGKGLFYDLATLDCLDFSESKWNGAIKSMTTVGNSIYGMRAQLAEPRGGVWFNKRLLTEAGVDPESIYDMQRDGTWTWEAFEEVLKKCTRDTDGDGVTDKYAMMSFSSRLIPPAIYSNGANFFGIDDDGKFIVTANDQAFLDAANWIVEMVSKYELKAPEGAEWNYFDAAFQNGETAFKVAEEYEAGQLNENMTDDYGFVMFPKGPNAETYVHAPTDNVYVIPANYDAERAWKVAFAFNLFTSQTPGYDDPDAWKIQYYPVFRDERAVDETLAMMNEPEHQVAALKSLVPGFDDGEGFCWPVYGMTVTPAEKVEEMMPTWQGLVDELNGK
jgi:ABC-type glycerol-3-phosphate transport system substrate-binding protein